MAECCSIKNARIGFDLINGLYLEWEYDSNTNCLPIKAFSIKTKYILVRRFNQQGTFFYHGTHTVNYPVWRAYLGPMGTLKDIPTIPANTWSETRSFNLEFWFDFYTDGSTPGNLVRCPGFSGTGTTGEILVLNDCRCSQENQYTTKILKDKGERGYRLLVAYNSRISSVDHCFQDVKKIYTQVVNVNDNTFENRETINDFSGIEYFELIFNIPENSNGCHYAINTYFADENGKICSFIHNEACCFYTVEEDIVGDRLYLNIENNCDICQEDGDYFNIEYSCNGNPPTSIQTSNSRIEIPISINSCNGIRYKVTKANECFEFNGLYGSEELVGCCEVKRADTSGDINKFWHTIHQRKELENCRLIDSIRITFNDGISEYKKTVSVTPERISIISDIWESKASTTFTELIENGLNTYNLNICIEGLVNGTICSSDCDFYGGTKNCCDWDIIFFSIDGNRITLDIESECNKVDPACSSISYLILKVYTTSDTSVDYGIPFNGIVCQNNLMRATRTIVVDNSLDLNNSPIFVEGFVLTENGYRYCSKKELKIEKCCSMIHRGTAEGDRLDSVLLTIEINDNNLNGCSIIDNVLVIFYDENGNEIKRNEENVLDIPFNSNGFRNYYLSDYFLEDIYGLPIPAIVRYRVIGRSILKECYNFASVVETTGCCEIEIIENGDYEKSIDLIVKRNDSECNPLECSTPSQFDIYIWKDTESMPSTPTKTINAGQLINGFYNSNYPCTIFKKNVFSNTWNDYEEKTHYKVVGKKNGRECINKEGSYTKLDCCDFVFDIIPKGEEIWYTIKEAKGQNCINHTKFKITIDGREIELINLNFNNRIDSNPDVFGFNKEGLIGNIVNYTNGWEIKGTAVGYINEESCKEKEKKYTIKKDCCELIAEVTREGLKLIVEIKQTQTNTCYKSNNFEIVITDIATNVKSTVKLLNRTEINGIIREEIFDAKPDTTYSVNIKSFTDDTLEIECKNINREIGFPQCCDLNASESIIEKNCIKYTEITLTASDKRSDCVACECIQIECMKIEKWENNKWVEISAEVPIEIVKC